MGINLPAKTYTSGRNPDFGPLRIGEIAPDTQADMDGRIFAWPLRVAVEAGLRWGDLINSSPDTLVLTTGGLTGFAAKKPKRGECLEEDPGGASDFSFSNEKWMLDGYKLFMSHSGNLNRDFWICQPVFLGTQSGFSNQAPAFWPIANKMMTTLS